MSHRSGKRKPKEKSPKDQAKPGTESASKKTLGLLRRRRLTLAAVAGLITMLLIAVLGGRQPPRVTVINQSGEPLNGVRIDFPGGSVSADPVSDGGKASMLLRPDPATPTPPGSGPITLLYRVGEAKENVFRSWAHGRAYGAHDIITIARKPDGTIVVTPSPPGGGGVRFRDLIRRLGINI